MENKDLIYGKNDTERIVSIEVMDDQLLIFKEQLNGDIEIDYLPNKFWVLLNRKESDKFHRLDGDQYYKWLYTCDTREKYLAIRTKCYKQRLDFYSIFNPKESAMVYNGLTYFKGMKINEVSVLSFDIETDGLKHTSNSEIYCITNTLRKQGKIISKGFFLDKYNSQADMIMDWCKWVRDMDPSILLGHNILLFDLPYLHHVANINNIELNLGRDDSAAQFEDRESKFRKDGSQEYAYKKINIFGREIVDTWMLSIKYDVGRQFESYGLKSIVKQLGLEKKDRTFIDAGKIKHYFYNDKFNWEKVKQYALEDADDALKLFDLMAPATFYFTQHVSKPFQEMILSATGSQINNMMVRSYLQTSHSIAKADEINSFQGAISFGVPKLYTNVYKLDVSSLYPSVMRQYKIYNRKKDPKGNFLALVETFTKERLKNKKIAKDTKEQYYSDLEQSQKVGINSMYGTLGASGLNYNYLEGADEVTRRGREILCKAIEFTTSKPMEYWKELSGGDSEQLDE